MTKFAFFAIQNGLHYEQLKKPLSFGDDSLGVTNWIMKFPLTIYSSNFQEKHIFTEDSVKIQSHTGQASQERWKYFVLTNDNGERQYCTAQIFYQKGILVHSRRLKGSRANAIGQQHQQFYLPKCLVLMSSQPYFKMHVNLLKIYDQVRKDKCSISHPTSSQVIQHFLNLKSQGRKDQFHLYQSAQFNKKIKSQVILEYYIQKCNEHRLGQSILLQKSTNFPILHLYKLKQHSLFQFTHFYNLPLSSRTIHSVLTALLLQKQIIVSSKNSNLSVMVIQSLLQLIRPLQWNHMLVHNIPSHLLEVVTQNFMPFLVGINKKQLQNPSFRDKYILLIDEDEFLMPEYLPQMGSLLTNFSNQITKVNSSSSSSNQKLVLQNSIAFICNLMYPIIKKIPTNTQFYTQFIQTSLCQNMLHRIANGQYHKFMSLIQIQDNEQRILQIQRQLNRLSYYLHNPKFISNQIEWIEFYLNKTNPLLKPSKKDQNTKPLSLKEIKQSMIVQKNPQPIRKVSTMNHQRYFSITQTPRGRGSRSGQKIKVSVVKNEQCHPLLNQLLQQRLGLSKVQ